MSMNIGNGYRVRRRDSSSLPNYVYRCYDSVGRLIYVGCTVEPVRRVQSHRKNAWWGDQIARVRYTVFPDRNYALAKEREAIALEQPRWNVKGRWPYRNGAWTEQDYLDYLLAIREGSPVIGDYSARHLAEVQSELDSIRRAA